MKKILLLIAALLIATTVYAATNTSTLVRGYDKQNIQVFTPPATSPIVTISAAGDVTVSSYRVIMFDEDETIYWGSDSSNTYDLPANTPLGISSATTTIHVSAACSMLVM